MDVAGGVVLPVLSGVRSAGLATYFLETMQAAENTTSDWNWPRGHTGEGVAPTFIFLGFLETMKSAF